MDYKAPLKQRYVILAEHSATSLAELNDVTERLQRQFEARCFCPAQDSAYSDSTQLSLPVKVTDKVFLVNSFQSVMAEQDRVKVLDNCKRLLNSDEELILAASVAMHQLEATKFMVDDKSRRGVESRERELSASYT
jgi:hypothetical protein